MVRGASVSSLSEAEVVGAGDSHSEASSTFAGLCCRDQITGLSHGCNVAFSSVIDVTRPVSSHALEMGDAVVTLLPSLLP